MIFTRLIRRIYTLTEIDFEQSFTSECFSVFIDEDAKKTNLRRKDCFAVRDWKCWRADKLGVRFFKKIQDWILKSDRIQKWILRFFIEQINPRSFGSWCFKGTEESTSRVDSSVPLTHHDPKDLGLICLVKKRKIHFQILSDLRIQSWIFLKKRTLGVHVYWLSLLNLSTLSFFLTRQRFDSQSSGHVRRRKR